MKLHSRVLYLIILPVLVLLSFLVHSYISFHSVNYSDIQRVINLNNGNKYTKLPSSKPTIRIQSWNIKYDSFKDFETIEDSLAELSPELPDIQKVTLYSGYKESSWSMRRFGIVNDVLFNDPDIFCVQEAMKNQLDDLDELLGYQWKWLGKARDDGKEEGEHAAIFFKRSRFDLINTRTLWLTSTPNDISDYPGAYAKRVATVLRLKLKATGDKFTVINTHFDQKSEDAKQFSAKLLKYVGSHERDLTGIVFLTGDLNTPASGKKSTPYQILTSEISQNEQLEIEDLNFYKEYRSRYFKKFKFKDLLELAPAEYRSGHLGTVTGWGKPPRTSSDRIDYIMGGVVGDEHDDMSKKSFEVLRYRVGENLFDYGPQLSDHRPVFADVVFY